MKVLIVLAAFVAAACAARLTDAEIKPQWEEFKAMHGKTYENEVEEAFRMKIFKENTIRIAKHNARFDKGEVTFKVGINKFSDMHTHEVAEKLNGFKSAGAKKSDRVHKAPVSWPWSKKVDWRKEGYVTPIKDQGQCGSCWSFSATGSLEGQLFKKNKQLVSLSEQNLVDCSGNYGNYGCDGGLMDAAFQYIQANGGVDTEASYPYTAEDGTCKFSASNVGGTDTGFVDVNPTEKDLQHAVQTIGPVSVAIDASQWSFQQYASGIYYEPECSSEELDHGVLAVGFGSEWLNKDYWLVKNSWGDSWGEQGYIRMSRNKDNNCGIATEASYPTV